MRVNIQMTDTGLFVLLVIFDCHRSVHCVFFMSCLMLRLLDRTDSRIKDSGQLQGAFRDKSEGQDF